jgi:hypothetical protein
MVLMAVRGSVQARIHRGSAVMPFPVRAARRAVVTATARRRRGFEPLMRCHAPQIRLSTSRAVRSPQVRYGMESEGVGRRLAGTGVVGTWLGTGFRTSRTTGGPKMAIQVSGDFMTLAVNGAVTGTAPASSRLRMAMARGSSRPARAAVHPAATRSRPSPSAWSLAAAMRPACDRLAQGTVPLAEGLIRLATAQPALDPQRGVAATGAAGIARRRRRIGRPGRPWPFRRR